MRWLTLCVALLALPCAFGCQKPSTPEKITSKDGKISAVFPGKPTESKDKDTLTYDLESRNGGNVYSLSLTDFLDPNDLANKTLVKKIFEDGRTAAIRALEGTLLSKKDLTLGKFPGQTYDARTPEGVYRSRRYLTEKSFVQIIVYGPKEFVSSPEAMKFLDSLKIAE